jgi:hypothetical protein
MPRSDARKYGPGSSELLELRVCLRCFLISLAHELTPPNGTDRVRTCIQVGKKGNTCRAGGAIAKNAGTLRRQVEKT